MNNCDSVFYSAMAGVANSVDQGRTSKSIISAFEAIRVKMRMKISLPYARSATSLHTAAEHKEQF
jgi:hypothetical protein